MDVAPPRRLDHAPIFQVMFHLEAGDAVGLDLSGLQVEPVGRLSDHVKVSHYTEFDKRKVAPRRRNGSD